MFQPTSQRTFIWAMIGGSNVTGYCAVKKMKSTISVMRTKNKNMTLPQGIKPINGVRNATSPVRTWLFTTEYEVACILKNK